MTVNDMEEIKQMLRLIIDHFHIGKVPQKTIRDIKSEAEATVISLTNRKKRGKQMG